MNSQTDQTTNAWHMSPGIANTGFGLRRKTSGLLAGLGIAAVFLASAPAWAATAPALLTTDPYGVLSSTYANTVAGTTITGDLGYVAAGAPAVVPTVSGATVITPPAQAGLDQGSALVTLTTQSCTSLGAIVALNAVDLGAGPGVFPPGCYSSTGAMNIALSTTVTLSGDGVYVFKSGGAITTGANSRVVLAGGACESDVFWTGVGATTLGAYTGALPAPTTFVGTIIDDAGITLGEFATLIGRALAFGGTVTTDKNTITVPTCVAFAPPVIPAAGSTTSSKAFFPTAIAAGGVSRLTITLSNNSGGVATLDAGGFTDTLPVGMVIAPTASAVTSCGVGGVGGGVVTAIPGAGSVNLSANSTIPDGAPGMCTVAVNVTAVAAGSYINLLPVLNTDLVETAAPGGVTLTVASAADIPTLSEWAMIMLTAFLAITGFAAMRRQSR